MIASSSLALLASSFATKGSEGLVAILTNSTVVEFAVGVAVVSSAMYFVLRRLHWI